MKTIETATSALYALMPIGRQNISRISVLVDGLPEIAQSLNAGTVLSLFVPMLLKSATNLQSVDFSGTTA